MTVKELIQKLEMIPEDERDYDIYFYTGGEIGTIFSVNKVLKHLTKKIVHLLA